MKYSDIHENKWYKVVDNVYSHCFRIGQIVKVVNPPEDENDDLYAIDEREKGWYMMPKELEPVIIIDDSYEIY